MDINQIPINQFVIAVCGVGSVWCSQSANGATRRWASILGLIAQPAWFYAAWHAEQWGIFAMAFVYTVGWARGFYNFWLSPTRERYGFVG